MFGYWAGLKNFEQAKELVEKMPNEADKRNRETAEKGIFKIENSITIDELDEKLKKKEKILITIEELFKDKREIKLEENELKRFLNGVKIEKQNKDYIYRIYSKNTFIGIGLIEKGYLKRDIII